MEHKVSIGSQANPSPHGLGNKLTRLCWGAVYQLLFRPSPRPFHAWRALLLRLFGARVGRDVRILSSVRIWLPANLDIGDHSVLGEFVDCYNPGLLTIGRNVTVSQYSFLCGATHDPASTHMALVVKPITLEDQCWIAADVFVGPGVTVGEGSVVGARASVFKDLPAWKICTGSPAVPVRDRVIGSDD